MYLLIYYTTIYRQNAMVFYSFLNTHLIAYHDIIDCVAKRKNAVLNSYPFLYKFGQRGQFYLENNSYY